MEWWTEFHEYEGLEFLGELKITPRKKEYGPFFGLTYSYLKDCLEEAINGVNKKELAARERFDLDVQQSLLNVMQAQNLQVVFHEYLGYLEGEDYDGVDDEDCWDSEGSVYKLSSDGEKFVIL